MAVDLELAPKQKRPNGQPCCEPVVYPDVERVHAVRMATVAKALGDPIRLQLVDVLRKHAGKVCVCELVPLFDISQPTLSHHLKKLRDAGIVDSERQADRVAEGLRDLRHAQRLVALDLGVDDRLAAPLTGGTLVLGRQLQIDRHRYTYIN